MPFDIDLHEIVETIDPEPLARCVTSLLASASSRFWTDPASSTGKYHPDYDNGFGGLVRHTVVVAAMAVDGCRRYGREDLRHVVVAAALCHDLWKNGASWGKYTVRSHGPIASEKVSEKISSFPEIARELDLVSYAVAWHYGIWCKPEARPPFSFMPLLDDDDYSTVALVLQEADFYCSRAFLGDPDEASLRGVLGCQK